MRIMNKVWNVNILAPILLIFCEYGVKGHRGLSFCKKKIFYDSKFFYVGGFDQCLNQFIFLPFIKWTNERINGNS
jgi:hypothetical protein